MKSTEHSLENQALLEQILPTNSERRIYCEIPEEAETSQEVKGTPEVFLFNREANSGGERKATLAAFKELKLGLTEPVMT